MALIRPRLTDFHGIHKPQSELDFAIPFFDKDIPLYVDPFLLWKSPSQQDQALHTSVIDGFNFLGQKYLKGNEKEAAQDLVKLSECDEVGLGTSISRKGKRISEKKALETLSIFKIIPHYKRLGVRHIEEIQLLIDGISKDRISDLACSFLKSFLIDFTMDQCINLGVPTKKTEMENIFDTKSMTFKSEKFEIPFTPDKEDPILFVPKRWLKFNPWISYDNYFQKYCPRDKIFNPNEPEERVKVLNFNRDNYGVIKTYFEEKEHSAADCVNDPLFSQIPISSAKRTLTQISNLPTGNKDKADRKYEDYIVQLLASLFYPHLDYADDQVRTESGTQIRDLIFYNTQKNNFLKEIFDDYSSKQIVFEIKNVKEIEREHINQLNRYMTDSLGKFGVIVTRNEPLKKRVKNTIDLWAGQRRCILFLTDKDLSQMVEVFETKQRFPIDVLKKRYVEFRRLCPS